MEKTNEITIPKVIEYPEIDFDPERNNELASRIEIMQGDISELKVDVIVNAADSFIEGAAGLSKKIHEKCGKGLLKYLQKKYSRINIGSIVKSPAFKLKCKKIIHAVGPSGENETLLSGIYTQCLDYCCNRTFLSIAFPCISAGCRGYPNEKACIAVLKTVRNWLQIYYQIWKGKIIFCCHSDVDYKLYQKYLTLYFPVDIGPKITPITEEEKNLINNLKQSEEITQEYYDYNDFHADSSEEAKKKIESQIAKYCPDVPEYPNPLPEQEIPIKIPENVKMPSNLRESIINMLYGQAVGDAVGLSTEFLSKDVAYLYYGIGHIDYSHYYVDRHRTKWMNKKKVCNDWTDDTDQCILILDSLIRNNGNVDIIDFAKRCKYWMNFGFVEIGDIVACGVGNTFSGVVDDPDFINDPVSVSEKIWKKGKCQTASNGCVMRTSVVSIPYFWDQNKILENAKAFTKVTHFDPRCSAAVVTIVSILGNLLNDRTDIDEIIKEAIELGQKELSSEENINSFLKFVSAKNYDELELNINIGFTFKPMGCAILCLKKAKMMIDKGNYEKSKIFEILIEEIAREAGDADTNGAVVGAVLGCYLKEIPERFLKLQNIKWYQERINRILKLYQLEPIPI